METTGPRPTPDEAAATLAAAEATRTALARSLVLPRYFYGAIGTAVATQIATTTLGLAGGGSRGGWLLAAGVVAFLLTAGVQLARFRQLNGVRLAGLGSRVVGGTANLASTAYGLAFGGALWAAFAGLWWLVAACSLSGGVGYAVSGRRWVRAYRAEPASNSRGESAIWLGLLTVAAAGGLAALVIGS